jgi:hypothetical protein
LAHWTYSRQEWKSFLRWKKLQQGFFHYMLHLLRPVKQKHVPEIRITPQVVLTNDVHEPFHNDRRQFRKIMIHDVGDLNIMEISYAHRDGSSEIRVPIPKGKLREAIGLQDQLMMYKLSIV